eukprot:scaffold59906_cov48-Phaeocystis_antarctica.AAC.4
MYFRYTTTHLLDEAEELHGMRTLVWPVHLRLDLVRARLRGRDWGSGSGLGSGLGLCLGSGLGLGVGLGFVQLGRYHVDGSHCRVDCARCLARGVAAAALLDESLTRPLLGEGWRR